MMRTVWKFPMWDDSGAAGVATGVDFSMPEGAIVVAVGQQEGVVTFWAEVNDDARMATRRFCLVGTGHPVPDVSCVHVGAAFVREFVFHLYEMAVR